MNVMIVGTQAHFITQNRSLMVLDATSKYIQCLNQAKKQAQSNSKWNLLTGAFSEASKNDETEIEMEKCAQLFEDSKNELSQFGQGSDYQKNMMIQLENVNNVNMNDFFKHHAFVNLNESNISDDKNEYDHEKNSDNCNAYE